MFGSIPEGLTVDHKNGIRDDNCLENLRLADNSGQGQNQKMKVNNTSGFVGVSYVKRLDKWLAQIEINNINIYIGVYEFPEEASKAYVKAKIRFHTFNPVQR
jgi:hypothetical protein